MMIDSFQFISGEQWYCVRTKPKKERSAALNIKAQLGFEIFCPQIRFRRKTARGAVWFQEAMFPGYIFVRFDMLEYKRAVSYAVDVLTIPVFDGRHVPVPDAVIAHVQSELDERDTADSSVPLEVGDETTILEGSMQGLKVKVVKLMPAQDRVAVLLEMLGRLVKAEFPSGALEHRRRHVLSAD